MLTWIGCASQNYRVGRPGGHKPELIVLHRSGGSLEELSARFNDRTTSLSAHYAVGESGVVNQFVKDEDTAFHAGMMTNPTSSHVRGKPGVNPNFYSIGIEHEGGSNAAWSEPMLNSTAALISEVGKRWSIPLDEHHIITHAAIRPSSQCPGVGFDIKEIVRRVREPGSTLSNRVTVVPNTNLRSGPSTGGAIFGVLPAGSEVLVTGFVEGERIKGNNLWYIDEQQHYFWAGATDRPQPGIVVEESGDATTDLKERPFDPLLDEININRTLALPASQYYPVVTRKNLIVLHFTAGSTARGAVDSWKSTPAHVATAYVVERDGTIYEVFNPDYWAYHLGVKGGDVHEKRSIGIEIVNVGALRQSPQNADVLNWWPPEEKFRTKYCQLDEQDRYVRGNYRGEKFFATFPLVQMKAVSQLTGYLLRRFSIPSQIPSSAVCSECDPQFFQNYAGIANHGNFRRDKTDIGPAFAWDALNV